MARRRYSDNDKAAALAALDANGGNVSKTAKQINIPATTLDEWRNGRVNSDVPILREQKKIELSERLDDIAHAILDELPHKLPDATAQQLATAFGIIIDKKQLLTNKPTDRVAVEDTTITDEQRVDRITALLERARARRDGRASESESSSG